jgi:copper oxidase (laccase) domain-containing protein
VYEAFHKEGFSMESISMKYPARDGSSIEKWHINLPECNRQQLLSCGIPYSQITVSEICTYQQHERFFSARRLGINSGRIFTAIMMKS